LYDNQLRSTLAQTHRDWCVAIEPDSGEYFLGRTLSGAVDHALQAYPERVTYTLRVGHAVVFTVGGGRA
jgi:hypothetical protein